MRNFFTGLVANIVYGFLVLGVGVMMAYSKKKGYEWVDYVLYGLGAAAIMTVIAVGFVGFQAIPPSKPRVTADNVEGLIKTWAEDSGTGVTKPQMQMPDAYFNYTFTLKNQTPISVFRLKGNPKRLEFHSTVVLTEENQKIFSAMTKEQQADVIHRISLGLGLAKLGNGIVTATPISNVPGSVVLPFSRQMSVDVIKGIPISELDEETFVRTMDEVDSGVAIVRATMSLAFRKNKGSMLY